MLLQTNSYVVPPEKRAAHAKLLNAFRQALARVGCDLFEVYEQSGPNWESAPGEGRFVQIMRFRDREHQLAVQAAERNDAEAQRLISEFCELINFPYQQEHGLFAVGFYTDVETAAAAAKAGSAAAVPAPVRTPAPAVPKPASAQPSRPKMDVDAYIERELDDIISTFGDPREMLVEPPPPIRQEKSKAFPRLADAAPEAPPAEEELDALLEEQFAPAPREDREADAGDPELSRVLDQGLADDELDIPLPAELLDDDEDDQAGGLELAEPAPPPPPPARAEPAARPNRRVARR